MSYFSDFPIIASGLKYAHSIKTSFVSSEHEVDLPPIIPAKFIISLFDLKTKFLSISFISLLKRSKNEDSSSISSKVMPLLIFL